MKLEIGTLANLYVKQTYSKLDDRMIRIRNRELPFFVFIKGPTAL
jgi:hypothetical protein